MVNSQGWRRILLNSLLYAVPAFAIGFVVATVLVGRRNSRDSGILLEDLNKDGKPDLLSYYSNDALQRIEFDRNFDGNRDDTVWYDREVPVRSESDDNFDGKVDVWSTHRHGLISLSLVDTDFDGVPDATQEFQHGVLAKVSWRMKGTNQPGKVQFYAHGVKSKELIDADRDGVYEITNFFDAFENLKPSANQ